MATRLNIRDDSAAIEHTAAVIEKVFPAPRPFGVRLWDGSTLPGPAEPPFTLVLRHPGALRRMFSLPIELSIGEAYIYQDFDVEGDLLAAVSLVDMLSQNASFSPGEITGLLRSLRSLPSMPGEDGGRQVNRKPADLKGEVHSLERDSAAIRYHYDVGNDFYTRWLDPAMQYSCAYFPTGEEPLEQAQQHKMEHICRKLRLKAGERLLDIGCGWGGLARYAAEKFGAWVTGVTLSEQQAAYAGEHLAERVDIRLQDYRTLEGEPFDKIVSVGMFEHVGRAHLPEYFAQAYRLLKAGGLFLNHGISRQGTTEDIPRWPGIKALNGGNGKHGSSYIDRRVFGRDTFSKHYVFPDGELVPVSAANLVAEAAGFEVRDVESLREHYAQTLRHWVRRLGEKAAELTALVGEDVYRTWRLFLSVSAHGFDMGSINLHQTLLAKPDLGRANLPWTRADLYR